MAVRKIIEIDEEKCDGCGQCVLACAEGALKIIDGKAKVVSDVFCDGLGACIGECPQGAYCNEQDQCSSTCTDEDPHCTGAATCCGGICSVHCPTPIQ